ncbi:MAG TPA: acyl-CoA dehydrogenase [Syntrophomonas sp.]|nr:acyl-CoA dehydrogenase [Syntrophomonas sp.]
MAANNFLFDTRDLKFILKEWLDLDKLLSFEPYRDYYSKNDVDAFVDVVYKMCRDQLAPVNEDLDKIGARFIDGRVVVPESVRTAYHTVINAGFGPQFADREVEGHLPRCMSAPLSEMIIAASAALFTYWSATDGVIGVIQEFGTPEIKQRFIPKLYDGIWGGTMNLTEPSAGSEVGNTSTKALPTDKPGIYKIKGTKIFITSADNDIAENFVHLVLARVEGAREGTAGLSLFIVPKIWVNEDGTLGDDNDVTTVGIEHKMGLKGSATCTMSYGENDACYGIIFGNPPGEDGKGLGMAQMFKMMNEERLVTGLMALATSAEAYYNSLAYAKERVQGTKFTDPKGPRTRIIEHEDVRRMLLRQKSVVEAMRALIAKTYYYMDLANDSPDPEERAFADARFQLSNPLCKAYISDMAWPLIAEAIQIYGGYGFTEEYPCAQLARDCKIFSIWEGTNFIQSMDLVGRKFTMHKGTLLTSLLQDIQQFITENKQTPGFEREFAMLTEALSAYQEILGLLNEYYAQGQMTMGPLFSTRILHATAMIYCATLIMDQGLLASRKLDELGAEHFDAGFYQGKAASARFYVMNVLPDIFGIKKAFAGGDTTAIDIPEEALG